MDFKFDPQEEAFRDEVRAFIDEYLPPEEERTGETVLRFQQAVREKRWVGFSWPEEYGGGGGSIVKQVILKEEMAKAKAPSLGTCYVCVGCESRPVSGFRLFRAIWHYSPSPPVPWPRCNPSGGDP